tara:strand:+ start:4414 stop:5343 length:930 start_codon:yes stop_codon:yes gene_type:complete
MKKTISRISLGLASIFVIIFLVLTLFQFDLIRIYEPQNLKWIPILITIIAFYVAGTICRKVNLKYISILFIGLFFIYVPFDSFYFPFAIYLFLFSSASLAIAHKEISRKIRIILASVMSMVFVFFLLNQPLIIKQNGFGLSTDGRTLFNAKVLWNFNAFEQKKLPSETFLTIENEIFDLKTLEGKTIYLSFWATWCGPCLAQKPELDRLKEEFKNNSKVVFIDISLDNDSEKWKEYLKIKMPKGIQLISKNEVITRKNYQITGIPRHIIINKLGNYGNLDYLPVVKEYLTNEKKLTEFVNAELKVYEKR